MTITVMLILTATIMIIKFTGLPYFKWTVFYVNESSKVIHGFLALSTQLE